MQVLNSMGQHWAFISPQLTLQRMRGQLGFGCWGAGAELTRLNISGPFAISWDGVGAGDTPLTSFKAAGTVSNTLQNVQHHQPYLKRSNFMTDIATEKTRTAAIRC